jgi:hypothetical protein
LRATLRRSDGIVFFLFPASAFSPLEHGILMETDVGLAMMKNEK